MLISSRIKGNTGLNRSDLMALVCVLGKTLRLPQAPGDENVLWKIKESIRWQLFPLISRRQPIRKKAPGGQRLAGTLLLGWVEKKKHSILIYIVLYNAGKVFCKWEVAEQVNLMWDEGMVEKASMHAKREKKSGRDLFLLMHQFSRHAYRLWTKPTQIKNPKHFWKTGAWVVFRLECAPNQASFKSWKFKAF